MGLLYLYLYQVIKFTGSILRDVVSLLVNCILLTWPGRLGNVSGYGLKYRGLFLSVSICFLTVMCRRTAGLLSGRFQLLFRDTVISLTPWPVYPRGINFRNLTEYPSKAG